MIPPLLDIIPSPGAKPSGDAASAKGSDPAGAGALFRSTLAAVNPPPAAPKAVVRALPHDLTAVQSKIAAMLAAGASQRDVIATLAANLAGSIAQTLDTTNASHIAALQAAFAKALGPPVADGPAADQARILAQRFTGIAATAQAIAGETKGQQKRFSGHLLDAQSAKELPAPATATTLSNPLHAAALALPVLPNGVAEPGPGTQHAVAAASAAPAPAVPASPATQPADAASPAQAAVTGVALGALPPQAPAGDGKRVNLGSTAPVAAGGDTILGRTLARAALAAVARENVIPVRPPVAVPAPVAAAAQPPTPAAEALTAFMTSFENALHAATSSGQHTAAEAPDAATAALPAAAPAAAAADAPPAQPAAAPAPIDRGTAPANVPPAAAPVDHSAIADQVLRGAFMRNIGQSSEMRLTLVPETLGDVNIKLVVNAGSVTAHVVAQTPDVRDALVAAQPQLSKALADAGLKLSAFSVDLSGNFAGFAQQHSGQSGNGQQPRRALPIADADADDETLIEAIPTFGPGAAPAPTPGDYNYLV